MIVGTIPFTFQTDTDIDIDTNTNTNTNMFPTSARVLLINSRKHPEEWLLPKGGWEMDEDRMEGAVRESWEEAGVVGELLHARQRGQQQQEEEEQNYDNPLLLDFAVKGKNHDQLHTYYGLRIKELKEEWPEREERGRRLFTLIEAEAVLCAQQRRRDRVAQCAVLENLKQLLVHQVPTTTSSSTSSSC